jgi:lipid A 3-O-deacylase PagL
MKRIFRSYVFATALVLPLAVTGTKMAYAAPVANDSGIEAAGGFFHTQGSDSGQFNADVAYSYYLTPGWEIGLRQALNYEFVDDARDTWRATTTPFLAYNFHFGNVVPFLALAGGIVWNDRNITGTLGPNAGVKFFFSDQTYLGLRYRYEWFFHSIKGLENNADHGQHVGTVGIGFVWGGSGKRTP